jgi:hypothetical protein
MASKNATASNSSRSEYGVRSKAAAKANSSPKKAPPPSVWTRLGYRLKDETAAKAWGGVVARLLWAQSSGTVSLEEYVATLGPKQLCDLDAALLAPKEDWRDVRLLDIIEEESGHRQDFLGRLDSLAEVTGRDEVRFACWLLSSPEGWSYGTRLGAILEKQKLVDCKFALPSLELINQLLTHQWQSAMSLNAYTCVLWGLREMLLHGARDEFKEWAVTLLAGRNSELRWNPLEFADPRGDLSLHDACPGRDLMDWQVEVVARIGYEQRGIDRRFRVAHHLRRAVETEALLYVSKPGYRDHLDHVLAVWTTGEVLLNAVSGKRGNGHWLSDAVVSPALKSRKGRGVSGRRAKTSSDRRKKVLREWYLSALYHDLGYLVDGYKELQRQMADLGSDQIGKLVSEVDVALNRGLANLNRDAFETASLRHDPKSRPDHGIVSYSHLRELLKEVDQANEIGSVSSRKPTRTLERDYSNALTSILLHNLSRETIDAREHFLAALLVICDELQEWGRFRLPIGEGARRIRDMINIRAISKMERWGYTGSVDVENLTFETGQMRVADPAAPVVFIIRYKDQNQNVYNPLDVLLFKVANLQRIRRLQVPIAIELRFPPLRRRSAQQPAVGEIDILRRYAEQEDVGWIDPQLFTLGKREDKRGVVYFRDSDTDVVRINVDRLSMNSRPLLSKMPWECQEQLLRFKREYVLRNNIPCAYLAEQDRTELHKHVKQ